MRGLAGARFLNPPCPRHSMGTRGTLCIVVGNRRLTQYVHFDSYSLFRRVARSLARLFRAGLTLAEVAGLAELVRDVGDGSEPTSDEIALCREFSDLSVRGRSEREWYCLLRRCQGDLLSILSLRLISGDGQCRQEFNVTLDFDNAKLEEVSFWDPPMQIGFGEELFSEADLDGEADPDAPAGEDPDLQQRLCAALVARVHPDAN